MKARKKPFLIGIAGGSGAGKSWLAKKIAEEFGPQVARFSLDDFYRDRSTLSSAQRARINFDNPDAVDWDAFLQALTTLKEGKPATIPCYDFAAHCRLPEASVLNPERLIVVDGLWLLRKQPVRNLFDLSVFVDCSASKRLRRRIARDCKLRGRTVQSVKDQFARTVEPMHQRYVLPQARQADVTCLDGVTRYELEVVLDRIQDLMEDQE